MKRVYFGKVIAEIALQNGQGRFFNTRPAGRVRVTQGRRNDVLVIDGGSYEFEYDLGTDQYEFHRRTRHGTEPLYEGWDGLSNGQQMSFLSELYGFMNQNDMAGGSFDQFIGDMAVAPNR